jgi:hypothetical protein
VASGGLKRGFRWVLVGFGDRCGNLFNAVGLEFSSMVCSGLWFNGGIFGGGPVYFSLFFLGGGGC